MAREINITLFVCKEYQHNLHKHVGRISNHSDLTFSDEEVITIHMFGIMQKQYRIKDIHEYSCNHLRDWFPALPGYGAFVQRLNKLSHLFEVIVTKLQDQLPKNLQRNLPLLVDSMPIILAHRGRRFKACVAKEIAKSNGYCATKKLYYYGIKLHMMGGYQVGSLPIPKIFGITEAGTSDIRVYEQMIELLPKDSQVFASQPIRLIIKQYQRIRTA